MLTVLRANRLFTKRLKCTFGTESIEYLGHIISAQGVAMDNSKVEGVFCWPVPRSTRGLRGFLELTVYYRKFIKSFSLLGPIGHGRWAWDPQGTTPRCGAWGV
jgi:hypothetical protein